MRWNDGAMRWGDDEIWWNDGAMRWKDNAMRWSDGAMRWNDDAMRWSDGERSNVALNTPDNRTRILY